MKKSTRIILIILLSLVAVLIISAVALASLTYSCQDPNALQSNDSVKLKVSKEYIFFDGEGTDYALAFYPGGLVEYTSYCALLKEIASKGIDCFLIKSPLGLAITDIDGAEDIIDDYHYPHWYVGGHSLGGAVSCMFAQDEDDDIEGIILLASYSSVDLRSKNLNVISIYGNRDGVLNMEKYNSSKANLPGNFSELVIDGANHSQFGFYGFQKGDGQPTISSDSQKKITSEFISGVLGI